MVKKNKASRKNVKAQKRPSLSKKTAKRAKFAKIAGKGQKPARARATPRTKKWKALTLLANPVVRQHLIDLAGENTLAVIREFEKEMSDEELARRTKIKVSEVRAVLNKMHCAGLVNYLRNRDKDSGWYSYIWKVNQAKMEALMPKEAGEETENADDGGEFYVCHACSPQKTVPFDRATELLFRCESCGASLEFLEPKKKG